MIFYHFTTPKALGITKAGEHDIGKCWPEGIQPHLTSDWDWTMTKPAVWMTTEPEPNPIRGDYCFVRLQLRIPSTDRKLQRLERYLIKTFGREKMRQYPGVPGCSMKNWWMYYGVIPVGLWFDADVIDGWKPGWMVEVSQ